MANYKVKIIQDHIVKITISCAVLVGITIFNAGWYIASAKSDIESYAKATRDYANENKRAIAKHLFDCEKEKTFEDSRRDQLTKDVSEMKTDIKWIKENMK